MAQGEFWVERQNWARWPRVLKVNRVTDSGTETRRYVRKGADWEAKDYATRKIAELQAENAKLRELVRDMVLNMGGCALHGNPLRLREFGSRAIELGIEVVE